MTHEEAFPLLPAYALGALDEDVDAFESHLQNCRKCKAELSVFLETTMALGEAVKPVSPPASLRDAVLAVIPERPTAAPGLWERLLERLSAPSRAPLPVALALVVLAVGLIAWVVIQQQQLQATHSELALNERGLALLTSTETSIDRLAPVADPASQAHGHWYHHVGVNTQVLVVEFVPTPPQGEAYYGWFRLADGSWRPAGPFSLDNAGYGRLILLGSDGSDVRTVVVTGQAGPTAQPAGQVILQWPAP